MHYFFFDELESRRNIQPLILKFMINDLLCLRCHTQQQLQLHHGSTWEPSYDTVLAQLCPIYQILQLLHSEIVFEKRRPLQLLIPGDTLTVRYVFDRYELYTNKSKQEVKTGTQNKPDNQNTVLWQISVLYLSCPFPYLQEAPGWIKFVSHIPSIYYIPYQITRTMCSSI